VFSNDTVEVRFTGEHQSITGDQWRDYEALDDGEVIEVRTRCGAYADGWPGVEDWTDAEADAYAAQELAARRRRRSGRT
jgi:hypothetical protein